LATIGHDDINGHLSRQFIIIIIIITIAVLQVDASCLSVKYLNKSQNHTLVFFIGFRISFRIMMDVEQTALGERSLKAKMCFCLTIGIDYNRTP
jgi:uncharacterized membrane protein YcfT